MTNPLMEDLRQRGAVAHAIRRTLWRLVLAVGLLLAMFGAANLAHAAAPQPLILGADADPDTYTNRWAELFFSEVFRRLDIPIQIIYYPLARRTLLVDSGEIDVDLGRVRAYGDAHPRLLRVEESWIEFNFALFAAKSEPRLQSVEELRSGDWLVEYRRGILFCEKTLKPLIPAARLADISSEIQGLNKLLAGRTDLYCDLDYVVRDALRSPEIKGASRIRKVLSIGTVPIYTYLQPRHAELLPRLSAVLKKMKAEGMVEVYQAQVAREMGPPQ